MTKPRYYAESDTIFQRHVVGRPTHFCIAVASGESGQEHARVIAAALNACTGLSPAFLESGGIGRILGGAKELLSAAGAYRVWEGNCNPRRLDDALAYLSALLSEIPAGTSEG